MTVPQYKEVQNDEDDELVRPPMSDDEKYFNIESRGASENCGGVD